LSDQVKSLDWKVRRAKKKASVPPDVMRHVRAKMKVAQLIQNFPICQSQAMHSGELAGVMRHHCQFVR